MKKYLFCFLTVFLNCSTMKPQMQPEMQLDSLQRILANDPPDTLKASVYISMSRVCQYFDTVMSNEYANRALRLSQKLHYNSGIGQYYLARSEKFYIRRQYKESVKNALLAAPYLKRSKNLTLQLAASYNITGSYIFMNEYGKAEANIKKTFLLLPKAGYGQQRAFLYEAYGALRLKQERYYEAISFYNEALQHYRKLSFPIGVASVYNQISIIYEEIRDFDQALHYELLSLDLLSGHNSPSPQMVYMSQIRVGRLLCCKGMHDEAMPYITQALAATLRLGDEPQLLECYRLKAEAHYGMGLYKKAIQDCHEAFESSVKAGDRAVLHSSLAKAQLALGLTAKAKQNGYKALSLVEGGGDGLASDELAGLYRTLAAAEFEQHHYREAYRFQHLLAQIEKEMLAKQIQGKTNELMVAFEVKEKDLRLKNMVILQQRKDLDLARQKSYLNMAVSSFAVLCVILGFTYFRFRSNKRYSAVMKAKNADLEHTREVLEVALHDKNLLLREIHHRVKNNLQQVISLLNIHARESNDMKVNEFLKKGRSRIVAMALLHENLYQNDALDKVDFKKYMESLVTCVVGAYALEKEVRVKVESDDTYFDIQTSIPLGLIVTELVCNSLKYAFEKTDAPLISVSLKSASNQTHSLIVADNGGGCSGDGRARVSFGLEIVGMFVKQLSGTITSNPVGGTSYTISFQGLEALLKK